MSFLKAMLLTAVMVHGPQAGTVEAPSVQVPPVQQVGTASWYGQGVWHGDVTANGEDFNPNEFTCAHRNLPFNTVVLVENLANGRRAWCRVNDRGPYNVHEVDGEWTVKTDVENQEAWRGIIDLSVAMARKLKMKQAGLQTVYLRYWTRDRSSAQSLAMMRP
ncbi:MAG: septal ring lytic transglycosylase RlpA family protein [Bradymonadaceae bacterium]